MDSCRNAFMGILKTYTLLGIPHMPQANSRLLNTFMRCHMNSNTEQQQNRGFKTKSNTSYYDTLGITPKATQAQVKAAYYALSKRYHPDVNKSKNAQNMFAQLSEAYEVLGDKRQRRMYDRGILNPTDPRSGHAASQEGDDFPQGKAGEPFYGKRKAPPPTGRTQNYNFDEFYKQHYGETMKRRNEEKHNYQDIGEIMEQRRLQNLRNMTVAGTMIAAFIAFVTLGKHRRR